MIITSNSLEETQKFGRLLASHLQPGDVVSLIGDLGAGKTHLVQAIAAGLGADSETVHSPTFALIQEYDARIPLVHIDTYRLRDIDEFLELGADELLGSESVCLIEWADRVEEVLPHDRLTIRITATGISTRQLEITGAGVRSTEFVVHLEDVSHFKSGIGSRQD